jgi:uncharacterized protein YodC (DUF2158 family)
MAVAAFKAGDTVRLKSGGPLMTVKENKVGGSVLCEWFNDKSEPHIKAFAETSLEADDGKVKGF